jgi:hypothetical protein
VITNIDALYFKWLIERFDNPSLGLKRICGMLHENIFQRRVGNDVNRAIDGEALRREFLSDWQDANIDERVVSDFLLHPCSWFEMLMALADSLDYVYDCGVTPQFLEFLQNLQIDHLMERTDRKYDSIDQDLVDQATNRVDGNMFDPDGFGGLFPLNKTHHPNQRGVEIWDQQGAYFSERLEGVMW